EHLPPATRRVAAGAAAHRGGSAGLLLLAVADAAPRAAVRIGVVGAGAVGGYYAARFAAAGHEVAVVARGAHLDAIRGNGLIVRTPDGSLVTRPQAYDDPSGVGVCDLVLFAVKTYD